MVKPISMVSVVTLLAFDASGHAMPLLVDSNAPDNYRDQLAKEATYGNMINLPPRCHLPMRSNNHDYG
jgi:hypothetical protein